MKFTVHTMEYAGGRAETSLDLRNYQDSNYEEYRTMFRAGVWEGAFYSGPWRFWNQRDAVPQSSMWQTGTAGPWRCTGSRDFAS